MHNANFLPSISAIASRYDFFILDLWGVIHDGQHLYPKVRECLEHLRQEKKKIVFLSNAPRRAVIVETTLLKMGISRDLYDYIITSGETFYHFMQQQQKLGNNYFYIGLEKDRKILEGLPYIEVSSLNAANFLLLSHSYTDNQPMEEIMPFLQQALAKKLPVMCVNPDKEIVRLSGEHVYCAGKIAEIYESLGGKVHYFGKPYRVVYDECMKYFNDIDNKHIIAIGDNLLTDIAGANQMGITSALVTGGMLKKSAGHHDDENYKEAVSRLINNEKVKPDYIIPAFNWS